MPADSVIRAAIDLYETLTASNFPGGSRPPIHFDLAPQTTGAGAQLDLPYCVLKDGGVVPQFDTERNGIEPTQLTLEVYASTLADVDAVVKAVKWNGQDPGDGAGFDFGTLSLNAPAYHMALVRQKEQRFVAEGLGKSGQRVHGCRVSYKAQTVVKAGG